jgi:integrase
LISFPEHGGVSMRNSKKIWTDTEISSLKFVPLSKKTKTECQQNQICISKGLYLFVSKVSKIWYVRYRNGKKQVWMRIGEYNKKLPDTPGGHMSLYMAQQKALEINNDARNEKYPNSSAGDVEITFDALVEKWLDDYTHISKLTNQPAHRETTIKALNCRLREYVTNQQIYIEKKLASKIKRLDITNIINQVTAAGKYDTAKKVLSIYRQIFEYGAIQGYVDNNPVPSARGLIRDEHELKHRAAILEPCKIGMLMRQLQAYFTDQPITGGCLLFLSYCFTRPVEMRKIQWKHVDFENKQITIPKENIKIGRLMEDDFIIPMAHQVCDILKKLKNNRGGNPDGEEFVFHSQRDFYRPISDATPTATLAAIGIDRKQQSAHGFRRIADTCLHEISANNNSEYKHEIIEMQLTHQCDSETVRAYNSAKYMKIRIKMMQDWANYLDSLAQTKPKI